MRCNASGDSSAPGTVTTVNALSETPASSSARMAPWSSSSPISGLNRESTMPTRNFSARGLAVTLRKFMAKENAWERSERRDDETAPPARRGEALSARGRIGEELRIGVTRDLQTEARHAGHLARPGEQPHLADIEVAQNLRADAVIAQVHPSLGRRLIGQRTLSELGRRLGPVQQNQHARSVAGDRRKRRGNRPRVRPAAAIEQVEYGQRLVHAHQRLALGRDRAAGQREMRGIGELVAIGHEPKLAFDRPYRALAEALDQPLRLVAIVNEIGDGADLQSVQARELDEIGQPGHGPVVLQD